MIIGKSFWSLHIITQFVFTRSRGMQTIPITIVLTNWPLEQLLHIENKEEKRREVPFSPFFQFITMRKTHVLRKVIDKISIFAMMIIIVFSINEVLLMKDTSISYHTKIARQRTERLRTLIQTLPPCCQDFFRGIEPTTTVLTRLIFADDFRLFFHY